MTNPSKTGKVQWRWDRFDAKKVTSVDWAARNCVGRDSDHQAMQRRVLQDERSAGLIIAGELHQLLHDAAKITGMTYLCKFTNPSLPCINTKDIRLSWCQNGSRDNLQRLAWMWYYYGTEIHELGWSSLTHNEWVERKVMTALNVSYVHLAELAIDQRTWLQQLYSKKFNALRTNVLRRGPAIKHTSLINKEQPKVMGLFKKNFKRGKSTFFVTKDEGDKLLWRKVSGRRTRGFSNRVFATKVMPVIVGLGGLCGGCTMDGLE
jgi:hypothetical protein